MVPFNVAPPLTIEVAGPVLTTTAVVVKVAKEPTAEPPEFDADNRKQNDVPGLFPVATVALTA
jgi:hypothetical protein